MNFTVPSVLSFWASWFAMCVAMALLSGWRELAGGFAGAGSLPQRQDQRFRFVSGSVSQWRWLPIQYHLTFFLTLSTTGFRLEVFFPMRLLHSPIYVPWCAVDEVREEPLLGLFRQTVVTVGERHIRVRGRAGEALLAAWRAYQLEGNA